VHVSEISKEKIKTPVDMYKVGDELTAKVMNINTEERRIGLSIKRLDMDDEESVLKDYLSNMKSTTSSFGEILRENLQEKINGKSVDAEVAEADEDTEASEEVKAADQPKETEEIEVTEEVKAADQAEEAEKIEVTEATEEIETADQAPEPEGVPDEKPEEKPDELPGETSDETPEEPDDKEAG